MKSRARHESRVLAVQFLFQRDFNRDEFSGALERFWDGHKGGPGVRLFSDELIAGVEAHRETLDDRIRDLAENWDVHRMGAVDRAILRVALFEILYREDIPPIVSVNEAVELAKEFSGVESGRFVNGILDRSVREAARPARCAKPEPRFQRAPPRGPREER